LSNEKEDPTELKGRLHLLRFPVCQHWFNTNTLSQRAGRGAYPSKGNSGAVGIPVSEQPAFFSSRPAQLNLDKDENILQ